MSERSRLDRLDPERRDAILDSASEQFAAHGYDGASYNRILAAAGVSKGAAYYYFADKEALYQTVLRRAVARVAVAVGDLGPMASAEDFWRELAALYLRVFTFFREHPALAGLAKGLLRLPPRAVATGPTAALYAASRAWFRSMLERGQAIGAVRADLPMGILTDVLFAMGETLDRWTLVHWDELQEGDPEAVVAMCMDLFRRVLTPAPQVRPQCSSPESASSAADIADP